MFRPGDGRTQQWEDKMITYSRKHHLSTNPVAQLRGHTAVVVVSAHGKVFQVKGSVCCVVITPGLSGISSLLCL